MPSHYLYEHPNPHARLRTNGIRFHGYPTRLGGPPDLIVVHDTESILDRIGLDTGAENVARYQSQTDRPSSYHRVNDSDSGVLCLPDEATAFGARGANNRGLHVSLAMRTVDGLSTDPQVIRRREAMLERTARDVAEWCERWSIPVRLLLPRQYEAGLPGIVSHAIVDPGRRSDPGAWFPWTRFLARVAELVDASRTPIPPLTVPEGPPMFLVQEPHGPRLFLVHTGAAGLTATHVNPPQRDALLEARVPILKTPADLDDDRRERRRAILELAGVTL